LKKAAESGFALAMLNYGVFLTEGLSLNKSEASVWYKKAAEVGDVRAMFKYGSLLFEGFEGRTHTNEKHLF
jgi:TPR repeat protein